MAVEETQKDHNVFMINRKERTSVKISKLQYGDEYISAKYTKFQSHLKILILILIVDEILTFLR